MWYSILIAVLSGYLLGNLNGAVTISVLVNKDDVRGHGSGNAGLTNFIRNYGGWNTLFVLLIDVCKAVLACLLGGLLLEPFGYALEGRMLGAVSVSLGHDFPAFLKFKGGKGIVCGAAMAACLDWRLFLVLLVVFAGFYFTTMYVSLGSVMGALAFAVMSVILWYDNLWMLLGGILVGSLAIFMHRENIRRLLKGTESKTNLFALRKKAK